MDPAVAVVIDRRVIELELLDRAFGGYSTGDITGIVSERDGVAAGADLDQVQVHDLMTADTVTVTAEDTVRTARACCS